MFKFISLLLPCFLLSLISVEVSALSSASDSEIKATFLFNLGRYITWPANTFNNALAKFHLCILGQDPFKEKLDIVVQDQRISGHTVNILRLRRVEDVGSCHILFVSDSEQLRLPSILEWLAHQPILTVSDIQHFVRQGGMVEFYPRQNRIRLMINPQIIKEVGLIPSSRLLAVSDIIDALPKRDSQDD